VYVNKDNPLQKLTLAQLDAIFSKTRKRGYKEDITTWGQLGLTGEWAKAPINLYGLNEDSTGVDEWFRVNALLKGKWRDSVTEQPGPKELVQRITEDRFGIGFTGVSYLDANIRIVALSDSESGPYSGGSMTDVLSGKYPLTRSMYIYINKAPGKSIDQVIKEFLAFVLSKEGQETAVKAGELLPLPPAVVSEEKAKLEKIE
jgi:phosphate transport system substrate-binding protein